MGDFLITKTNQGKSKKWIASALSQENFRVEFEMVELSIEDQEFIKKGQEAQKWDYQELEEDDQ